MRARSVVFVLVLLASARATAEPAPSPDQSAPLPRLNIREPARVCTLAAPTRCRDLPPGVFTDAPTWVKADADRKVEQSAVTRLTAENESLRESAAGWQPGWRTVGAVIVVSLISGAYIGRRFSE